MVFLDEPTSGMDPYSRRFTWEVVRRMSRHAAIVLTTHSMEEADTLADDIVIMAQVGGVWGISHWAVVSHAAAGPTLLPVAPCTPRHARALYVSPSLNMCACMHVSPALNMCACMHGPWRRHTCVWLM